MSLAKDLDPLTPVPSWVCQPDEDDEWWSDEPQMESSLHMEQISLLIACLKWWWQDRSRFFVAGNISIYYGKNQGKKGTHRFSGPDFFLVKDVSGHPRKSWMVWREDNRFPNLIVEILSSSTAKVDRTDKKRLYQNTFKTPEYFWFHPWTLEFAGFKLVHGKYQPIPANARGHLWSEELQLFVGIHKNRLRFFTLKGKLVPISQEDAVAERKKRQVAQQKAEQERQKREQAEQQRERAEQQAKQERLQREQAEQHAKQERLQRERAEQHAKQEHLQRKLAEQQAKQEHLQRELAEQQAEQERLQRELAQNQLSNLEGLLEQYRNDLAALRDRLEDGKSEMGG